MARRAAVLIDLQVSDPSGELQHVGKAGSFAAEGLDDAERSARRADKALDRLGKVGIAQFGDDLERFGGMMDIFGDAGTATTRLGDSIQLLADPLGAAVGLTVAWGVALVSTVAGAVALVGASDDLIQRLDTVGRTEVITDDQRAQLEAARGAITSVGDAWAEVGLILAAEFGPAVEAGADLAIGATLRVAEAVEWLAGKADVLTIALNVLTGGAVGQASMALDLLGVDIAGPGGLVESLQEEGRAYAESATQARKSAEATKSAARAHVDAARQIRDASEIVFGSGLGSGFSSEEILPAGMKADLAAFAEATDRMNVGLEGLLSPVERANAAYEAHIAQIQADVQATGDLATGMILLNAAFEQRAQAEKAARTAAMLGSVEGVAGVLGGNVGGVLAGLGPGGSLLGMAIELGPDTIGILDEQLETIGDNLLKLPETLAGLLAKLIGFGADNAGQGIGRFLGAVLGGTVGFFVGGGPVGAAAGAAVGSAALGQALGGGRNERTASERATRQAPRSSVTINGIVTTDVLRSLDREARIKGGARGLRMDLARGT